MNEILSDFEITLTNIENHSEFKGDIAEQLLYRVNKNKILEEHVQ